MPAEHPLGQLAGADNAVLVAGQETGEALLIGVGAGVRSTARAVLADVVAAAGLRHGHAGLSWCRPIQDNVPWDDRLLGPSVGRRSPGPSAAAFAALAGGLSAAGAGIHRAAVVVGARRGPKRRAGVGGAPGVGRDITGDWERFLDAMRGGRFFDAHDCLEPQWRRTGSPRVQAAVWLAVLLVHQARGNSVGVARVQGKLLGRLDALAAPAGLRAAACRVPASAAEVCEALASARDWVLSP